MPTSCSLASVDIVLLSNGPGEVITWVRPVLKALRAHFGEDRHQTRISLVLSPCVHATGQEAAIAQTYPELDRIQAPEGFWPLVLWGKTIANWNWRPRGVVLFLGGDQFFAVVIGRRLGYGIVTYAEWSARWLPWIDYCGVRQASLLASISARYQSKVAVVGDLIAEAQTSAGAAPPALNLTPGTELIGLLPGSKPAKLTVGVPLGLAIASHIQRDRPQTRFVLLVAPTLDLQTLADYARNDQPLGLAPAGGTAELVTPASGLPYLLTDQGVHVDLWIQTPAYEVLAHCQLCLTTVGANTAELTALAVPMLILLPTHRLDLMRAWDGIPGLLANLPGLGTGFTCVINWLVLKRGLGLRAWPNLWAGREIVPELVGDLQPQAVAQQVVELLANPTRLDHMRQALRQVCGQPGAAAKLVSLVHKVLTEP